MTVYDEFSIIVAENKIFPGGIVNIGPFNGIKIDTIINFSRKSVFLRFCHGYGSKKKKEKHYFFHAAKLMFLIISFISKFKRKKIRKKDIMLLAKLIFFFLDACFLIYFDL
ncbi:MAG: hypothetical protein J5644_07350 [Bacteroidales bacterium]|nr:hypothetical protein [Bacteroidales bacterium]